MRLIVVVDVLAHRAAPSVLLLQLRKHIGFVLDFGQVGSLDSAPVAVDSLRPVHVAALKN